jgi:cysteinyl-tRNA synthetase
MGDGVFGTARLSGVVDSLVTSLLKRRDEARRQRDFAAADAIREQLTEAGVVIEDTPAGPRWELAP